MPSNASFVYTTIGNTYKSMGDFIKAVEYHGQSLAIAKEVPIAVPSRLCNRRGKAPLREPRHHVLLAGEICEGHSRTHSTWRLQRRWATGRGWPLRTRTSASRMGWWAETATVTRRAAWLVAVVSTVCSVTESTNTEYHATRPQQRLHLLPLWHTASRLGMPRPSSTTGSAWRLQRRWASGRGRAGRTGTSATRMISRGTLRSPSNTTRSAWRFLRRWATGRRRAWRTGPFGSVSRD
jgi:hypothetical protein